MIFSSIYIRFSVGTAVSGNSLNFLFFFFFRFRNNYLPCQIHPEKLDTTRRSPGNRNEARLKKTRGKFMSAIYQLWIWGVVMVIWRSFLRVLFPLSSFALGRGAISLFREGFSIFFCFLVSLFCMARRGVSQCKISARPEIIKQQPTAAWFRYFGKLKSRSLIE